MIWAGFYVYYKSGPISSSAIINYLKLISYEFASRAPWPENTLESFVAAAEHGADMIEFDVQVLGTKKSL